VGHHKNLVTIGLALAAFAQEICKLQDHLQTSPPEFFRPVGTTKSGRYERFAPPLPVAWRAEMPFDGEPIAPLVWPFRVRGEKRNQAIAIDVDERA